MAEYPALSLWTDAYLADTTDLTAEEHGAYLLLLMAAWRSPTCSIPDDDERLARMARVGVKKWHKLRPIMERFWTVSDGEWTQKRLLKERERNDIYRSQKRQAGIASALKRKETASTGVATGDPTGDQLPLTSYPYPSPEEKMKIESARERAPPQKRKHRLPEDWQPSEADINAVRETGVDTHAELTKFRDHFLANGGTKIEWGLAFRNWCRRSREFGGTGARGAGRVANSVEADRLAIELHKRTRGTASGGSGEGNGAFASRAAGAGSGED